MCGIWARINRAISEGPSCDCADFDYDPELNARGPDSFSELTIDDLSLIGCVLHLRGESTVVQPLSLNGIVLLWNGELYGSNIYGCEDYDLQSNDTLQILIRLQSQDPLKVFSEIEGCFAFILLKDNCLWFGRDFMGKRSLIVSRSPHSYTISSIGPGAQVPTGGIFKVDSNTNTCSFIQWPHSGLCIPSTIRFTQILLNPEPFEEALEKSVRLRLIGCGDLGILFSGGIDCTVLAALSHKHLEPKRHIFLLNVAFEENAPDRITAISSYTELRALYPDRCFKLILINSTLEELETQKPRILKLMGKNDTRMDFSIVSALFFASRGEGIDFESSTFIRFPGKILLSGMGADEIFGGYSRYKSAFGFYGSEGLVREMSLDIDRLWHRNLGRDDRVTACHARELRFPYLDSHLWQALAAVPLPQVTQPQLPGNDKIILRLFARKIGLKDASLLKKRAIQFGTRISQICNRKDFGSNRKAKGWQSVNGTKEEQIAKELAFCVSALKEKLEREGENQRISETIEKLMNPSVKTKDKRHLMRVYLGDYTSSIDEDPE